MELLLGIFLVIGLVVWASFSAKAARRKKLLEKYGDPGVVERLMRRQVWEGMTYDHLIDSRGRPADIEEKVYKTKVVHTYKYHPDGKRRFRVRVMIENGAVVGWSER